MVSGPSGRNQKIINIGGCESSRLKIKVLAIWRLRKYRDYILNIKRIVCFYNFASTMKYEDKRKFRNYGLKSLFDYVEDMCQRKYIINNNSGFGMCLFV